MQLILRYGFLIWQKIPLALNDFQYILLILSTVLIAAAGYVINNIFDQGTDGENKPNHVIVGKNISETKAYNIYVGLNISGVAIGFYLANVIEKPGFAAIFIFIAATLYLYATSFKQMLIVGNVIVASLLAVSVLIVPIFDMFPMVYDGNREVMATVFSVISDYAIIAFILNFIREMVKDLEDVDGDYNQGMNTLPIALGRKRTSKLIFGLSIVPVLLILYYTNRYFFANNLLLITIYVLLFVAAPLIYFTVKMWDAKSVNDYKHLSLVLKLVILFGVFSIALLTYNIINHA